MKTPINLKATIVLSAVVVTLFSACTFTTSRIGSDADNKEGKVVLKKFYALLANKNFTAVDIMMSDSLKALVGPTGISKLLILVNKKVGGYKSYLIMDHYTKSIGGTNNFTIYEYKVKTTYDKGVVDELVGFRKDNGKIKLNMYRANSDLLIQ